MTTPPTTPLTQSTEYACLACGLKPVGFTIGTKEDWCRCSPDMKNAALTSRLTAAESAIAALQAAVGQCQQGLIRHGLLEVIPEPVAAKEPTGRCCEYCRTPLKAGLSVATPNGKFAHMECLEEHNKAVQEQDAEARDVAAAKEPPAKAKITKVGRIWMDQGKDRVYWFGWEPQGDGRCANEWTEFQQHFPGYTFDDLAILCIRENPREGDKAKINWGGNWHPATIRSGKWSLDLDLPCTFPLTHRFSLLDPRPIPQAQTVAEQPRVQVSKEGDIHWVFGRSERTEFWRDGKFIALTDDSESYQLGVSAFAINPIQAAAWLAAHPQPKQQDQATATDVFDEKCACGHPRYMHESFPKFNHNGTFSHCDGAACYCKGFTNQPGAAEVSSVSTGDCVRPSAAPASVLTEEEQNEVKFWRHNHSAMYENYKLQHSTDKLLAIIDRLVARCAFLDTTLDDSYAGRTAKEWQESWEATITERDTLKTQLAETKILYDNAQASFSTQIKNERQQLAQRDEELAEATATFRVCILCDEKVPSLHGGMCGACNYKAFLKIRKTNAANEQQLTAEKQAAAEVKKAYEAELSRLKSTVRPGRIETEAKALNHDAPTEVMDTSNSVAIEAIRAAVRNVKYPPGHVFRGCELEADRIIRKAIHGDAPRPLLPEGVKLVEMMKMAWEDGFFLCSKYGDNYVHFVGAQKDNQWKKWLDGHSQILSEAGFAVGEVGKP